MGGPAGAPSTAWRASIAICEVSVVAFLVLATVIVDDSVALELEHTARRASVLIDCVSILALLRRSTMFIAADGFTYRVGDAEVGEGRDRRPL